jgi:hypothetical protein
MSLSDKYNSRAAALYRDKVGGAITKTENTQKCHVLVIQYILYFLPGVIPLPVYISYLYRPYPVQVCPFLFIIQITALSEGRSWSIETSSARHHKSAAISRQSHSSSNLSSGSGYGYTGGSDSGGHIRKSHSSAGMGYTA